MSQAINRAEADLMALRFLRDHGPHTMGQINGPEEMAAALVFLALEKRGLVSRTNFGNGFLQYAITEPGLMEAGDAGR